VSLSRKAMSFAFVLLFLWQLVLLSFDLMPTVQGQIEPPAQGDWIIPNNDVTLKSSTTIVMNGNVTVKAGGKLTLDSIILEFNSTFSNEYRFSVEPGGQFFMKNTTIRPVNTKWRYTIDLKGKSDIRGSTFSNGGMFLDPNTIKVSYNDILITQSRFDNANGSAIYIYPGYSPNVNNNTIFGGEFGIYMVDNPTIIPFSSPDVANNTIHDTENTAIYIGEGTTPTVFGNKIYNPGNRGIHIQYTNAKVDHNYIINATRDAGIYLYGNTIKPSPKIRNNTIENSLEGFTASGPSKGSFEDNTIKGIKDHGILLEWGSETSLFRNHISGCVNDGIFMAHVDANPLIKSNELTGNNYNVRMESGVRATLIDNTFKGGRYGIWSSQSSPIVQGNRFFNQLVSSINVTEFYYSKVPTFTNNTIRNTDIGIDITQSNPFVQNNSIWFSNTTAINIGMGSTPTILGNDIAYGKGSGLTVRPTASPDIRNNDIDQNLYGTILEGSHMDVQDNRLHGNDFAFLCELGTDSVFHNDTIIDSTFFDFLVKSGSHPTVSSSPVNKSHVAADGTSSLRIQWAVDMRIVNTKSVPEPGAIVTIYNKTMMVYNDRAGPGGVLHRFTIDEAEVTRDGVKPFGPFQVEVQEGNARNTTILDIDHDINVTIYLNHPPSLSPLYINVIEHQPKKIWLTDYITDPDSNQKDFQFNSTSPHVTFNNTDKTMTVLYTNEQRYDTILLNISDGISTVTQPITVNITLVDDPPILLQKIPDFLDVSEDSGWIIDLLDYFTDDVNWQVLTFTASDPNIIIDNLTKTAHWNASRGGTLPNIFITAYEEHHTADLSTTSNTFTLQAITYNHPPIYLGGLKDTSVLEKHKWQIDLMDYFTDREGPDGLKFSASDTRITIRRLTPENAYASWTPGEGSSSIYNLVFTAYDSQNPGLIANSTPITLTVIPVDELPVFTPACLVNVPTIIDHDHGWQVAISDCYYDEEHDPLNFTDNHGSIDIGYKIDNYGRTWVFYIPPRDATKDQNIQVIFYARQISGDAKGIPVSSYPINFTYKVNQTGPPPGPTVVTIPDRIAWYLYAGIPLAIIATASIFYVYRRIKFHKYVINDVFLIFNDGRLVTHLTGSGEASKIDKDILASMLTAIQEFVKDSFSGREKSSLQEMKYGDQTIIIERGIFAYLSTVVRGNVTEKLKDDMKEALRHVEKKYATILENWDGDNKKLGKIDHSLKELIEKQPKNLFDLLRSY
jgi:nitrous oxidase accessory protein NosD